MVEYLSFALAVLGRTIGNVWMMILRVDHTER